MFLKPKKAFGLVELLITLAILSMLIGIILPQYHKVTVSGRKQVVRAQAATVARALQSWIAMQDTSGDAANKFIGVNHVQVKHIGANTWTNEILPLLDSTFVIDSGIEYFNIPGGRGYLRTRQSQELTPDTGETIPANMPSPWGNVARATRDYAHFTIVWSRTDADRYNTAPAVITFIPE